VPAEAPEAAEPSLAAVLDRLAAIDADAVNVFHRRLGRSIVAAAHERGLLAFAGGAGVAVTSNARSAVEPTGSSPTTSVHCSSRSEESRTRTPDDQSCVCVTHIRLTLICHTIDTARRRN
jgi:hypothetical protein